jgi:bacteriocin-like protein
MRELTNSELQAVSGGAAMPPPVRIDVRRIVIAVLEKIIARLGGDPMPRRAT